MAVCTVYSFVRITGKTWTEFSRGLKRSAPKLRFEVGFTHAWSKESCKRQQISRYRTIIIITATYSLTAAKLQTCEWPNLRSRRCRIRLADYRTRTTATAASTLCADILSVQTIKMVGHVDLAKSHNLRYTTDALHVIKYPKLASSPLSFSMVRKAWEWRLGMRLDSYCFN